MMTPTPQRILDFLRTHPQASAHELSQVFDLTPVNIRHHLNSLLKQGWIELAGQKSNGSRGRPTLYYRQAQKARANNYQGLSSSLLEQLLDGLSDIEKDALLNQLANRLAAMEKGEPGHSLTRRLNTLIRLLNACAYTARWEAHASGPVVFLGYCPYAALLGKFPTELCQMDHHLIENLLGIPVNPGKHCSFLINSHPAD